MIFDAAKDIRPWVNKQGKIQLIAQKKRTKTPPEPREFLIVMVRTGAAHLLGDDTWAGVASFPLVDDPDVSHRVQANRYLRVVAIAMGHAEFEGRYEL